ncbi:MAG TPA: GNAT family protein [Actinomycetota bacterium]|nr:GNAT family protein [Actinomycetota bacterium]
MEVLTSGRSPERKTPGVQIRETAEEDAEAFHRLLVANREYLRPFEPVRPDWFFTLSGIHGELERATADRKADALYAFGIWEVSTDALVGRIALANLVRGAWQNATLGYFVGRNWARRGYATEAVRQILDFAFDSARLHRVQAAVMPRNRPSIRVLEKNGFRDEGLAARYLQINGIWEDHRIYAVTAEDRSP